MRIAVFFDKQREDTTGVYFERAIRQTPHEVRHFWLKDAERIGRDFDFYLRIDHGDYKYDLPPCLRPSAFYAVDTHLKKPYRKIREQAAHYDFIFCAQKEGAEKLKKETGINAFWVPLGCDPAVHKNLNLNRRFDIAFVGTDGKNNPRVELLKLLACKYPNSFIGRADYRLMANLYGSAKIAFNYSIANDVNMRIFEAMACGTMMVTNRIKNNGFEELFIAGKHLVTYKDKHELLKLIDYYLTRDNQREKIAAEGCELVLSRHTYRDRVNALLDILTKRKVCDKI